MTDKLDKPTPETKALSLFLMAFKSSDANCKQKSKRINKLWGLVQRDELSKKEYLKEVEVMLASFGGYSEVVERTVAFYINKTGLWKLKGTDKYSIDAKKVADRILKK